MTAVVAIVLQAAALGVGPPPVVATEDAVVSLLADPACGDAEDAGRLAGALEARLGRPVVLGGPDGMEATIAWRDGGAGCAVRTGAVADAPPVPLPAGASRGEIRAAASRVAFLLAAAPADVVVPPEAVDVGHGVLPDTVDVGPDGVVPEPDAVVVAPPAVAERAGRAGAPEQEPAADPPAASADRVRAEVPPVSPGTWRVSVLPGVSSVGSHPPGTLPSLSLNVLAGRSPAVAGVEVGLVSNAVQGGVLGVQAVAGVNQVRGDVRGAQVAGISNVNGGATHGLQVAGVANVARGGLDGVQISGAANYAGGDSRGAQLGAVNMASDLHGVQMGIVNVGGAVDGFQLGLVNVSESVDAPIGLLNVVRGEPLLVTGGLSSGRFATLGLAHGGRRLRYLYLAGLHLSSDITSGGLGVGASLHSPMGRFFFDLDAIAWQLFSADPVALGAMYEIRAVAGWQINRRVAIRVGPSVKALVAPVRDGFLIPPAWAVSEVLPQDRAAHLWPELFLGLTF
jgi:hypothetical protein